MVGYHQTNQKTDTGKTLTRWPVLVDHNIRLTHGYRRSSKRITTALPAHPVLLITLILISIIPRKNWTISSASRRNVFSRKISLFSTKPVRSRFVVKGKVTDSGIRLLQCVRALTGKLQFFMTEKLWDGKSMLTGRIPFRWMTRKVFMNEWIKHVLIYAQNTM